MKFTPGYSNRKADEKLCCCPLTWCIYPATLNLSDGPDHVYL